MREQLASRLAFGIELLQMEGSNHYGMAELARITGISKSTLKRNKVIVDLIDTAIHISRGNL
ncbi:MAG: hypothetical protein Q9M43_06755 [Sulfurimonas sp.]|nr:hypothetical protein [Sulfurimonas sp.]